MLIWQPYRKYTHPGKVNTHSNVLETHADDEVGRPVGAAGHCHRSRPRTLGEQLCYEEPRYGTWAHLKEGNKSKDGQHADVAHRGHTVLSVVQMTEVKCSVASTVVQKQFRFLSLDRLTSKARAVVMTMAHMHIPASPSMWSVRRPVFSMRKSCEQTCFVLKHTIWNLHTHTN